VTHICVRDTIGYSYERATAELEHYMNRRRHGNGDITASLHLDLSAFGLAGAPAVEHSVHMQFETDRDESGPCYRVSWHPVPEGPYPRFTGTMRLASDERDPRATVLEVAGAYRPPLGALGAAFDIVIGRRIAAATLRAFVDDIIRGVSPESSSESRR
jgi:hypothetical protein